MRRPTAITGPAIRRSASVTAISAVKFAPPPDRPASRVRPRATDATSAAAALQLAVAPAGVPVRLCRAVPATISHACVHRSPRSVRARSVPYEHMFSPTRTSALAQRALGALRLTRSFLLLEDDYDVDWEVDPDEHFRRRIRTGCRCAAACPTAARASPLRGRLLSTCADPGSARRHAAAPQRRPPLGPHPGLLASRPRHRPLDAALAPAATREPPSAPHPARTRGAPTTPQTTTGRPRAARCSSLKKPAASYSPRPLRAKYHRR